MKWRRRQQHLRAALGVRRPRPRMSRIRPGALPGTLTAAESAGPPVIDVMVFDRDRVEEDRAETIDAALARLAPGAVTWINIDGLGDASVFARLGERLGLHPLALEDVLNVPQRPKVERFDKHLFIVVRTMRLEGPPEAPAAATIVDEQISAFFGADWVVTIQERSDGDCFGPVREAIRQGRGRVREGGADYLVYLLVDSVVDAYFPVIDTLAERMHLLEEEALGSASAETRVFLRDVYDHAVQALEIVESLREAAVSVMEVFLSAQNQRLNEVMKVLTVISTLFIPLTSIASI